MSASESYPVHNSNSHKGDYSSQTKELNGWSDEFCVAVVSSSGDHASYLAKWLPATITKDKERFISPQACRVNTGQTLGIHVGLLTSIQSLAGGIYSVVRPKSGVDLSPGHRGNSPEQT